LPGNQHPRIEQFGERSNQETPRDVYDKIGVRKGWFLNSRVDDAGQEVSNSCSESSAELQKGIFVIDSLPIEPLNSRINESITDETMSQSH
jgi:hypothetical protein